MVAYDLVQHGSCDPRVTIMKIHESLEQQTQFGIIMHTILGAIAYRFEIAVDNGDSMQVLHGIRNVTRPLQAHIPPTAAPHTSMPT